MSGGICVIPSAVVHAHMQCILVLSPSNGLRLNQAVVPVSVRMPYSVVRVVKPKCWLLTVFVACHSRVSIP